MRIDFLTIFPEIIESYSNNAIFKRAIASKLVFLNTVNIRDFATDKHNSVDDTPLGGGPGMVMTVGPIVAAIEDGLEKGMMRPIIAMSPSGEQFNQEKALELSKLEGFTLLCGRYEGIDERVVTKYCDGVISLGDFVLAGGELAALCVAEAVIRLVPGVLGNSVSGEDESFNDGLLEYPQYSRPRDFRGEKAPEILLSGDHQKIQEWRLAQSLYRTIERRPDLIEKRGGLSDVELSILSKHGYCIDRPFLKDGPGEISNL